MSDSNLIRFLSQGLSTLKRLPVENNFNCRETFLEKEESFQPLSLVAGPTVHREPCWAG